jgi:hypothetical protein
MQTVIQTSRRLASFFHEAAQNFELLSNIQDKIKTVAVDVLFKAYPMVPLSLRSIWPDGVPLNKFLVSSSHRLLIILRELMVYSLFCR